MPEIDFSLLQPVNTGALVQQGFATGAALVKHVQTQNALKGYLANPDDPQSYNALAAYDPATASTLLQQRQANAKMQREEAERATALRLGAVAASDPAAARTQAMQAGQFDLAKTFGELADADAKRSADTWAKAGSVAFQLKQLRSPEARSAYWQEAKGVLEQQGAPAALLDKIDPNNIAQIDSILATSQKVSELWQQRKPEEFNVGPGEGRYQRDPVTGNITTIIAPNGGAAPMGTPVGGGGAGGLTIERNNNPGALRKPGSKEFQSFASPEAGIEAQHAQLNRYLGRGLNNIDSIIETYAPRESRGGDNTDAQVENYKAYVSQRAGLDPKAPISPAQIPAIAAAMREFETGHKARLTGAHDAAAIRAAANRAIAAGADPAKVRERAAAQGVNL